MENWKIEPFPNDVIAASNIKITKTGTVDSISIKQSSSYLGSKNTATNENICKTCQTKCLGHIGVIELIDPVTQQKQPIFRPIFHVTQFVKRFLKLVCPVCEDVNTVLMSNYLKEAQTYYPSLPSHLKARFNKDLPLLTKRKGKCGQPNCSAVYSGFKYNHGIFTYDSNKGVIALPFQKVYRLFTKVATKTFILLVNDVDFDINSLFFTDGIPVSSTSARITATFNNNTSELFSSFYKTLVDVNEKIAHASREDLPKYQALFAKQLYSSIMKQPSTYSVKPSTPSIAVYTLGNDKHSLLNHKLIGGPKYPSGSAVASAKSDGEITKVSLSKSLAKGFLVSDHVCIITRKKILERLKKGLYRYLIRVKKDKQIVYNMTDQAKIDIQDGDMLLRYIETGDVFIMTRFPTLSRYSRVAFEAVITDDVHDMTIRVNIPVVLMYNLDFDGDKVFINTVFNASSEVDLITRLSANACAMNEMTGAYMAGVVQENQICLDTILRITNIPKSIAYILMDKHIDLLDEDKEFYTGRELLSCFIPEHITYPGLIENGKIIAKKLLGKQFGANSSNSVCTIIARCVSDPVIVAVCESINAFSYRFAYYHGFCIRIDHLIPDTNEYLEMKDKYQKLYYEHEILLHEKVKEIESRDKMTSTKLFYREIDTIIDSLTSKTKDLVEQFIAKFPDPTRNINFYNDDLNYFIEMLNQKLKVSRENLLSIYLARGKIKEPSKFTPGVNGKSTIYSLSNSFSLQDVGYSPTCHLEGATEAEATLIVSRIATGQFQDIHQKTADIGTINKKQLKYSQHVRANHQRNILYGDTLITPIANELGVLPKDLTKIIIDEPKNLTNQKLCEYYYEEILDFLTYYDKDQGKLVKKECMFYFHPYSFIRMYNDSEEDNTPEYNPSQDIIQFWKNIREEFFFMLRPVTDLIFITLLYFDPSKAFLKQFMPEGESYPVRITKNLWTRFETKVRDKLTYSFTSSFNGVQCATAIQASTTQQALSAHHTVSRMGATINANFVGEYTNTLRAKEKATDILTILTYDFPIVAFIFKTFRYATLTTLEANIKLEKIVKKSNKTEEQICRCTILIPIQTMQTEMLNVTDVWKMLSFNFSTLSYIDLFTIDFDVDKNFCHIETDIQFNTQEGSFVKHMTQLEIDLKKFNKGRENNFLEIQKLADGNYKIEMELADHSDFLFINTRRCNYMSIPLSKTIILGNLKFHSSIVNELVAITDPNLYFAFKVLADSQYSQKNVRPLSIKPDNNKILTASTFDTSLNLAESALKGYTDNGYSIESASLKGRSSGIGKADYRFTLNPFRFYKLEEKIPMNDVATEVPTELF